MNDSNIPRRFTPKRFAWFSAILCTACCAIVPILLLFGVTSVVSIGIYFKFSAIGFFIAAIIIYGYQMLKDQKTNPKKDCSCKDSCKV